MYPKAIYLEREALYKMVWTTPVTKLAATYGMSDRGFAKMCARLMIPVPGRGYWARAKNGRKIPVPPLRPMKGSSEKGASIQVRQRLPENFIQNQKVRKEVESEKRPENKIRVSKRIALPHPLVAMTIDALNKAKPDEKNRFCSRVHGCLSVRVGRNSISRAMRIMDALIKALEKRDYSVLVKKASVDTCVFLLDEEIKFSLDEWLMKTKRELTSSEKKDKERYPSLYAYDRYDYCPSGRLYLRIDTWGHSDDRRIWSDGKKQRLEDLLNSFVTGVVKLAESNRAWRLQREQEEREKQERIRLHQEQERLRREEEAKFQALETEVTAWHKSLQIRSYVEAVKACALKRHGTISHESH